MKLPAAEVGSAIGMQPQAPFLQDHAHALEWELQLRRAASGLRGLERVHAPEPARTRDDDTALESCGAPTAPGGEPAVIAGALERPSPAGEESLPLPCRTEREPERAPVRLHVQRVPAEGIRVWLGIDGDAALVAQRASAAVADLRRNLLPAGGRIAEVVCNGVPVDPLSPRQPLPLKDSP